MRMDFTRASLAVMASAALLVTSAGSAAAASQLVRNRAVRQVLIALALWAVVATGLAGAAWATTGPPRP